MDVRGRLIDISIGGVTVSFGARRHKAQQSTRAPTLAPQSSAGSDEARVGRPPSVSFEAARRQAWEDHNHRQEFEHELINRKTAWLLTSQSLLFAAYGLTLGDVLDTDVASQFRFTVQMLGILISVTICVGVAAVINTKRISWKDYRRYFEDNGRPQYVPAQAWGDRSTGSRLPWGVRTANTWIALAPDVLLPLVFIGAWVLAPS